MACIQRSTAYSIAQHAAQCNTAQHGAAYCHLSRAGIPAAYVALEDGALLLARMKDPTRESEVPSLCPWSSTTPRNIMSAVRLHNVISLTRETAVNRCE